jgi:hypothetical protein
MRQISVVGIDSAKQIFHVVGMDATGIVVLALSQIYIPWPSSGMISPVRRYLAYLLSYGHLEEKRWEHGVAVDHSPTNKHHLAGEIAQEYGGTESPGDQARHQADARVQIVSGCAA